MKKFKFILPFMFISTLFFALSGSVILADVNVNSRSFAQASIPGSEPLSVELDDVGKNSQKKTTPRSLVFAAIIAIFFMIKFNTKKKEGWDKMNSAGAFSFGAMLVFWTIGAISLIFVWEVIPAIIAFFAGAFAASSLLFWDVLKKKMTIIFSTLFYLTSVTYIAFLFL